MSENEQCWMAFLSSLNHLFTLFDRRCCIKNSVSQKHFIRARSLCPGFPPDRCPKGAGGCLCRPVGPFTVTVTFPHSIILPSSTRYPTASPASDAQQRVCLTHGVHGAPVLGGRQVGRERYGRLYVLEQIGGRLTDGRRRWKGPPGAEGGACCSMSRSRNVLAFVFHHSYRSLTFKWWSEASPWSLMTELKELL